MFFMKPYLSLFRNRSSLLPLACLYFLLSVLSYKPCKDRDLFIFGPSQRSEASINMAPGPYRWWVACLAFVSGPEVNSTWRQGDCTCVGQIFTSSMILGRFVPEARNMGVRLHGYFCWMSLLRAQQHSFIHNKNSGCFYIVSSSDSRVELFRSSEYFHTPVLRAHSGIKYFIIAHQASYSDLSSLLFLADSMCIYK